MILNQVTNGVAVRMAVLYLLAKCLLLGDQIVDTRQGVTVGTVGRVSVLFHESSVPD